MITSLTRHWKVVASGLIDSVQVIYNIFDQSPEKHLFPAAEKHNVGVLARVPFDEGSLTGSITTNSVFDDKDFRAFDFRGDRKQQVVEHVSKLQTDLKDVEVLWPRLPFVSAFRIQPFPA